MKSSPTTGGLGASASPAAVPPNRTPVIEHVSDRHVVGDAEGEVQVGEAVAAVHGERADGRSGNDALVVLREP
jgi:hypothetical protein